MLQQITPPQLNFLEELLIDCQLFHPLTQRQGFLSKRSGRSIKHQSDLTKLEALMIITELIKQRNQLRQNRQPHEGQEPLFGKNDE
jgi:hypothetical protein